MQRLLLVLFFILILALDFAALDDITTSSELNLLDEYLMLLISIPPAYFPGVFNLEEKITPPPKTVNFTS